METRIERPPDIRWIYMNITLSLDIMFVNKDSFVIAISKNLIIIIDALVINKRQEGILSVMNQIKFIYSHRGLCTTDFNAHNKFEPL